MIKLIVGNKGTGKTKALVHLVNEAVKVSKGNVVCIEKGQGLTYDINHKARLVAADEYGISGYDAFYGFISGLLAGNYDITDVFIDATFKIGGRDIPAFEAMIAKLVEHFSRSDVGITFTVSCDKSELSEATMNYAIDFEALTTAK